MITNGFYISDNASPLLKADVHRLSRAVKTAVKAQGRHRDSCDANAMETCRALSAEGHLATHVMDGVAVLGKAIWSSDAEERVDRIGHDWVEVAEGGGAVIVDGAIGQFKGQLPRYEGGDRSDPSVLEAYAETAAADYSAAVKPWLQNLSPGLSDMIDMMEPLYDLIGDRKTIKSASGNFLAQYVEDEDDNLYLIGVASPSQKLRREDVTDFKDMVALLLSKLTSGKTLVTTPHENSMRMLDHVVREAKKQGIELQVEKGMKSAFGNKPELRYQQVEVRLR